MKTLKYINVGVQGLFILLTAVAVYGAVLEKDIFVLAFVALFLGPYQVIISIIDVIRKGQNSKLLGHLILSAVYLLTWYLIEDLAPYDAEQFFLDSAVGRVISVGPPLLLAVYHWYLTFTRFNPGRAVLRPHVFDL